MRICLLPAATLAICVSTGTIFATESPAPLADAIQLQDRETALALLERGSDPNAAQIDGMTALHWAVYHDDADLTERSLRHGAKVDVENRYGVRPLSLACQNGNATIVRLLLTAGADANATLRGGETALMTAARTGRLDPVKLLIAHGANLNAKERKGQTALMWAAAEGNLEVVDALIEAGGEFREPLRSGFTPLFFAVREGRTDVVLRLLEAGIDVNDVMRPIRSTGKGPRKGTSPLLLAVENGHFELAAALLAAGADPNQDQSGYAPLHAITWVRRPLRGDGDPPPLGSGNLGSLECVRQLVTHGADVNARHGKHKPRREGLNRTGATPFLLSSETGDVPLMRLLLELGADPLLSNVDRCTPLLAACGVGVLSDGDESAGTEDDAIEAVELLLAQGADLNAVDNLGKTVMHGAAYKSWSQLVQVLADRGVKPEVWNRQSKSGRTPLEIAQGHRPGNFRPSPKTIEAIQRVLQGGGESP